MYDPYQNERHRTREIFLAEPGAPMPTNTLTIKSLLLPAKAAWQLERYVFGPSRHARMAREEIPLSTKKLTFAAS
jgi:hypothetical protein